MSSSSCRREQPWSLLYCGSSGLMQGTSWPARSYPCGFCKREFRSAQALGGHMNVHRRDRAKLRLRHDASPPPPAHLPPTKVQPPAPPLLPNLNYPPPHDYCHYQCQSPGAGGGDSSSSSPPAAVNLELGRPPADGATEEDDGLDLELRLASC